MDDIKKQVGPAIAASGLSPTQALQAGKIMSDGALSSSIVTLAQQRKDQSLSIIQWILDFIRELLALILGKKLASDSERLDSEAQQSAAAFYAKNKDALNAALGKDALSLDPSAVNVPPTAQPSVAAQPVASLSAAGDGNRSLPQSAAVASGPHEPPSTLNASDSAPGSLAQENGSVSSGPRLPSWWHRAMAAIGSHNDLPIHVPTGPNLGARNSGGGGAGRPGQGDVGSGGGSRRGAKGEAPRHGGGGASRNRSDESDATDQSADVNAGDNKGARKSFSKAAREPFSKVTEGILVAHGEDHYQHKTPEKKSEKSDELSYYVKIKLDNGETVTRWGKELKDVMRTSAPELGSKIRLTLLGKEWVRKNVREPRDDGMPGHFWVEKMVERNNWRVAVLEPGAKPKPSVKARRP